jgi:MYXO-CTERM domain-containing protein
MKLRGLELGMALSILGAGGVAAAAPVPWSHDPPGGLTVAQVPQFVAVTFDDGYGLEDGGTGGVNYIVDFMSTKTNPGSGNAGTFDGTPVRTTFYLSSSNGSDAANRAAWAKAIKAGHEAADHTISHPNGGTLSAGGTAPGRYAVAKWTSEIKGCKDWLGTNVGATDVVGFRTPYLGYNDNVFTTLTQLGFSYDSTLPNCFADDETAKTCSWPSTLDGPDGDADTLVKKAGAEALKSHPGLMEVPVSTVFVPDAIKAKVPATMPYPSIWEPATGKLGGLDYTILADAKLSPDDMLAILKNTLDQHLAGNRSPFVFCAHTFMYSYSNPSSNPDTPSAAVRDARWKALMAFINYALSKPEVRMRPVKDIVAWMQKPVALTGVSPPPADGGVALPPDAGAPDAMMSGGGSGGAGEGGTGGSAGTGAGGNAGTGAGGSGGGSGGEAGTQGGSGGSGGSGGAGGSSTGGAGGDGTEGGAGGSDTPPRSAAKSGCTVGGTSSGGLSLLLALAAAVAVRRRRR